MNIKAKLNVSATPVNPKVPCYGPHHPPFSIRNARKIFLVDSYSAGTININYIPQWIEILLVKTQLSLRLFRDRHGRLFGVFKDNVDENFHTITENG